MSSKEHASKKYGSPSGPTPTTRNAASKDRSMGSHVKANRASGSAPDHLTPSDVMQLQRTIGNQVVAKILTHHTEVPVIRRDMIGGIDVDKEGRMASWVQDDVWYHLNTTTDPYHVTQEGVSKGKKKNVTKTHYFFTREGDDTCKDAIGKGGVAGSKKKFSQLPKPVQTFVETHFMDLIG
jgi:hypothetical protein